MVQQEFLLDYRIQLWYPSWEGSNNQGMSNGNGNDDEMLNSHYAEFSHAQISSLVQIPLFSPDSGLNLATPIVQVHLGLIHFFGLFHLQVEILVAMLQTIATFITQVHFWLSPIMISEMFFLLIYDVLICLSLILAFSWLTSG